MIEPQDGPSSRQGPDKEMALLVRRLEDFLAGCVEQGARLDIEVTPHHLLDVVDRALLKAEKVKVQEEDPFERTAEGYFLEGMLEDLLSQPESIFEQVTTPEGETVYAPLSDGVWIRCLKELRISLHRIVEK